jgi:hypothetical protein
MITTGTPVSVALFEWLTHYAGSHSEWFRVGHPQYDALNTMLMGNASLDLTSDHYNFIKFLVLLMVSFDGGVDAHRVQSVVETSSGVAVQWDNGIRHEWARQGWDRRTRMAVDYALNRLMGFSKASDHLTPALFRNIHGFLSAQLNALVQQTSVATTENSAMVDTTQITPHLFVVLSALPMALLSKFYVTAAQDIPPSFYFDTTQPSLSAAAFFGQPVSDAGRIIDKVKMHYNLHFYATDEVPFLAELNQQTLVFIREALADPEVSRSVHAEIDAVRVHQWQPRQDLLALVLDHFRWPV